MSLRAVDTESPEVPAGASLARGQGRPGDLHEAITLEPQVARAIAAKAEAAGIPFALAATLLVELRLLKDDLAAAGIEVVPDPPAATVELRMSSAQARYLRALIWRRSQPSIGSDSRVTLPVRLLARTNAETLRKAAAGDLELAIRLEAAAVARGRTLAESGLACALGCARGS